MRILSFFLIQLFILLLKVYLTDITDSDRRTDDTYHTQRISTSVTRSDVEVHAILEDTVECFIRSTKTRSVRHSTIERSDHHRKICLVLRVKENVVTSKHHKDVEQDCHRRKDVQLQTTFTKTFKESRSDLQTNHKDKKNQSKVLYKGQYGDRSCKFNVTSKNAHKQHKGNAKRNTSNFNFAKVDTQGNDNRIQ